ncbi:hypothetical protein NQZ68_038483 [Dissostichus eleginoides]|nr:hypothetical protein NQZ68_038483 [Dissostichus eleginoides]
MASAAPEDLPENREGLAASGDTGTPGEDTGTPGEDTGTAGSRKTNFVQMGCHTGASSVATFLSRKPLHPSGPAAFLVLVY